MKIKEEFIPLILDGSKKYEFRNSIDKGGIYKIKDKYFQLKYERLNLGIHLEKRVKNNINNIDKYYCFGKEITKQEYDWLDKNENYFKNIDGDIVVCIYKWQEVKLKKLEIIKKAK